MNMRRRIARLVTHITLPRTLASDRLVGAALSNGARLAADPAIQHRHAAIKAQMNRDILPIRIAGVFGFTVLSLGLGWVLGGVVSPWWIGGAWLASTVVFLKIARA